MDLHQAARELFAGYLKAWNDKDFSAVAACFDYPSVFVLPEATVTLSDEAALIALLERIFSGLEAENFSHSTVGSVVARRCNQEMAILDARNVARLRGDGSVIENIDAHYVIKRREGQARFAVAIVCESGWQESKGNA
ncbi:MAG: hypothetical protein ABJN26_08170 [Stappiaceae bacterium]